MGDPQSFPGTTGLALVTGANGFIGSHLVEALLARGYSVRCLVRRTSDLTYLRDLPVEWAYASLDSLDGLNEACRGVDLVCHCAALTRALDEATFFRVNAAGTEALARACLEANPDLRRFLFVSSHAAAGPSSEVDEFLDEGCSCQPITWYGKSKLAAERALLELDGLLKVTIVRPAAVFGPRDRDFYAYFQLVQRGLNLQVGSEDRWVSLIHVRDLVHLLLLALESENAVRQTYFGCGWSVKRTELSDAIAKALHKRTLRITVPDQALMAMAPLSRVQGRLTRRPALVNDQRILDLRQRYWLCSGEKARRELGFVPGYDFETAVQDTTTWYLENGWL